MGDEYQLRFKHSDSGAVATCLGALSGAAVSSSDELEIQFRATRNNAAMPDAVSVVNPRGVYFCVNGGDGRAFLGQVVARLVSRFGPVAIDEWPGEQDGPAFTLLVLRCTELERSLKFYQALGLQFTPEQHGAGPHHYSTRVDRTVLELYPASQPRPVRFGLALSDVKEAVASVRGLAGTVVRFDDAVPTHAVIRDPDGNTVELSCAGE